MLRELHSDTALISQIGKYIIQSGGKRLRPLLVLLTTKACDYKGDQHIPLASIIEFLHSATLLHDDVVDKSDLRRGLHTANTIWGNASSVLVGDFLYSRTFQMIAKLQNFKLLNVLADATNVIAEGEVMQLTHIHDTNISESQYMEIIRCKTAMLFEASAHTAAILSKVSLKTEHSLASYGNYLGIAFQLIDDLLDYSGDSNDMGKNTGDDLAEGKPTLPLIYTIANGSTEQQAIVRQAIKKGEQGNISNIIKVVRTCGALEYTAQKAQKFATKAIAALDYIPASKYRDAMEDLARFAIDRTH
ncbi:MAG: polyprenyl synthetase family protein [Candidatus Endonucleobacter bathymodioli]|uniref:Octaprenyl diphosphate synthase n=1 Tax=Candidatus Endonucleibacter bathymodioli TaxID=539814 RepID=A0AA90NKL4_9GAMM|nr:polyprenyl synthetase family protein [Candidatus Endonucleobacter bathymodioli]